MRHVAWAALVFGVVGFGLVGCDSGTDTTKTASTSTTAAGAPTVKKETSQPVDVNTKETTVKESSGKGTVKEKETSKP